MIDGTLRRKKKKEVRRVPLTKQSRKESARSSGASHKGTLVGFLGGGRVYLAGKPPLWATLPPPRGQLRLRMN